MVKRLVVGVALVGVFLVLLLSGLIVKGVFVTFAAVISVYEMGAAFKNKGYNLFLAPAYCFAALICPLLYLYGESYSVPLWLFAVLFTIAARVFIKERSMEEFLLSLTVLVYPLPFYALLFILCMAEQSMLLILCAFACPLLGDSLAYFIGTLFGKHKLCPNISPKKTVEGAVASLFGSVIAGVIIYILGPYLNSGGSARLVTLCVAGLLCGVLGQLGDLFASAIKRYVGIKDFGKIFPGHGGIMDRLDSVLFCAPIIYAFFILGLL